MKTRPKIRPYVLTTPRKNRRLNVDDYIIPGKKKAKKTHLSEQVDSVVYGKRG